MTRACNGHGNHNLLSHDKQVAYNYVAYVYLCGINVYTPRNTKCIWLYSIVTKKKGFFFHPTCVQTVMPGANIMFAMHFERRPCFKLQYRSLAEIISADRQDECASSTSVHADLGTSSVPVRKTRVMYVRSNKRAYDRLASMSAAHLEV